MNAALPVTVGGPTPVRAFTPHKPGRGHPVAFQRFGTEGWAYIFPHCHRTIGEAREAGRITTAQRKDPLGWTLLAFVVEPKPGASVSPVLDGESIRNFCERTGIRRRYAAEMKFTKPEPVA